MHSEPWLNYRAISNWIQIQFDDRIATSSGVLGCCASMIAAKRHVAWLCAALSTAACAQVHNPDLHELRISPDKIVNLVPHQPVRLTNGADKSTGNQRLAQAGLEMVDGDLWQWTQAAVELARREIESRGGDASGDGENELILEVSDLELRQGDWTLRATAYLRVEYGKSLVKTFSAEVGSSRGGPIALEGALRVAVARMLSDREIQKYL